MLSRKDAMHDGVHAIHSRVEPVTGSHVPDDMLDVGALVPAPSTAQNANVLAGGHQIVDDDASYGAGATGDQYWVRHTLKNRVDPPDVTTARRETATCRDWPGPAGPQSAHPRSRSTGH